MPYVFVNQPCKVFKKKFVSFCVEFARCPCACVHCLGHSGSLPQSKEMLVSLLVCVSPAIGWRPVQGGPRLLPLDSWISPAAPKKKLG